jgi:hypothetical protein
MELSQTYAGGFLLDETERDVIERWRNGDKKAFEQLVKRHMTDAYLTALGFTGNAEDARDLSQDAFVKAFQARRRFDPQRPFYPCPKEHGTALLRRRAPQRAVCVGPADAARANGER